MAHTVNFKGQQSGAAFVSYNIGKSVGATGINIPVDVKLVQALLRLIYHEIGALVPPPAFADRGPIAVDGLVGPMTRAYILDFKNFMRTHGQPTIADGKIDPFIVPQSGVLTPHSHQKYVMVQLNDSASVQSEKAGKGELFTGLPQRQDIPVDLRTALRTVVVEL